jgi:DNA-binding CsgD family transcriptional regulator/tetratricopeptide (TPR) repeat protein
VALEAAVRPPAVVVVESEAGVGKSRLVEELLRCPELGGRNHYVGHSQQLSEPFPLAPLVDALRKAEPVTADLGPVAGALRPLLPELAEHLPPPLEPLGDELAERHRLFRGLREFLAGLGPTVLVLEDLHWADEATVEWLRFVAPQLPPQLALVCTWRQEELPARSPLRALGGRASEVSFVRVTLPPLDTHQVRELAETILGTDRLTDEFGDYLSEGSGGVPFAVEELLRLLVEREDLVELSGSWVRRTLEDLGVPAALRDSILERLQRLSGRAQAVVEAAAVLGNPALEPDLIAVASLPEADAGRALAETLSSALLFELEAGVYGFRHVLARQAVEDAISPPVRRRLHLRAARVLEAVSPRPVARLAHHYRAGGDTTKWIRNAEAAAERATSLSDHATAYRFLEEAVSVAGLPAGRRARIAVKLTTSAYRCFAHDEAIEIVRPLLDDETLSRPVRGELRLGLGQLLRQAGKPAEAYSEVERSVEELGTRPAVAARAMGLLAAPSFKEGRIDDHLHWLDRAFETSARARDRALRIEVAADRATTLLAVGDARGTAAIEAIPRPGSDVEELRQAARAHGNLADALLHVGHYGLARDCIRRGLALSSKPGGFRTGLALKVTQLQLDWLVGDWDGLEERSRLDQDAVEDWPAVRSDAEAVRALLLLARGDIRTAGELLGALADDFPGEAPVLAWLTAALARIRLAEERPDLAIREAARGLDVVHETGIWVWATAVAPVMVRALLTADRRAEAVDLTDRFADGLRGRDAPAASAALATCEGALIEGDGDAAATAYLEAERAWLALPSPYEAARARESAGCSLLAERAERGRELLTDALQAFDGLGAAWDVARVRRTLREHGVVLPYRGGRRGYGGELSPREAEVAGLACEGLSNREIATALFLSRKTVEHHLSASMRKLGVASRGELAGRLTPVQ